MRAGFIAIVGLPNVGKSTLLNHILGQKLAIVAPRPQTTRNRILGVRNYPDAQLILIDTPGLHRPSGTHRTELNRFMVDEVMQAVAAVDAVLLLVEAPTGPEAKVIAERGYSPGTAYGHLLQAVADAKKPTIVAVNKIDLLHNKRALLPILDAWNKKHDFTALMPISAATGEGVELLEAELCKLLPEQERLFPEEMLTDRAERWLAAEMVREQVFILTRQEIPYAVAITLDSYSERPAEGKKKVADVMIEATIHVEKEQQKKIVVGEGGRMVREIGARARLEISHLLDCPVHLKLFVRVDAGWTQTPSGLRKMGYGDE